MTLRELEQSIGLEGEVWKSSQWAAMVGINDWFGWQAFEDVPTSYLT